VLFTPNPPSHPVEIAAVMERNRNTVSYRPFTFKPLLMSFKALLEPFNSLLKAFERPFRKKSYPTHDEF
jgi:hypothetical protein